MPVCVYGGMKQSRLPDVFDVAAGVQNTFLLHPNPVDVLVKTFEEIHEKLVCIVLATKQSGLTTRHDAKSV